MAKLVITTGNFLAHGLNKLVQEVIDIGTCPAVLPKPVASTLLLPTDWNGLGAPADQTLGIVDQSDGAGVYLYQRNVDGILFDNWLHSWAALRGVTYWRDTVQAAALRLSVRIGGDTVAAVTAAIRNWGAVTNTGGSVTDVGAGATAAIRITGGLGGPPGSLLIFNNVDVSTPGPLLLVAKASYVGPPPAANPNLGGYLNMQDGARLWRPSWSMGGAINQFANAASPTTQMGTGIASLSAFERIDMIGQMGFTYSPTPPDASGRLSAQSFDQGYVPQASDVDCNAAQALALVNVPSFVFAAEAGGNPSTSIDVQELHALRVL